MNPQQYEKVKSAKGFIAALDQSGGSTPKALGLYGIRPETYSGEQQMFDLMHAMRTRIMTSPVFNGDRILGVILFEQTMDREIEGRASAEYLWSVKQVVPFLKVDKGLADEANGVQLMKAMPNLDALLARGEVGQAERAPAQGEAAGSARQRRAVGGARLLQAAGDERQVAARARCRGDQSIAELTAGVQADGEIAAL